MSVGADGRVHVPRLDADVVVEAGGARRSLKVTLRGLRVAAPGCGGGAADATIDAGEVHDDGTRVLKLRASDCAAVAQRCAAFFGTMLREPLEESAASLADAA